MDLARNKPDNCRKQREFRKITFSRPVIRFDLPSHEIKSCMGTRAVTACFCARSKHCTLRRPPPPPSMSLV
jgi:hypothetical protein